MPEGVTEERKKERGASTEEEASSVGGESSKRQDYLQATIESKVQEILGERRSSGSRRPIWNVLNDSGVKTIVERRAFVRKLQQEASLKRYRQELQREWDERTAQREQRRQERLQEVRPGFLSRFTNFFKERTDKLIEFLSEPNRQVERIRQIERQSSEEWREVFKGAGARLRGASGFLRGMAAVAFKGIGQMSTNMGERLGPKPDTSNRPATGTPAPGPGLNSLK